MSTLLEVQNLKKYFPVTRSLVFARTKASVKAVDGVNFSISSGHTFALVGESGCGKTTTAKLVLLLERPTGGSVLFGGRNIYELQGKELKKYRCAVQNLFQDPYSSLDPRMRVASTIGEPLGVNTSLSKKEIEHKVAMLLEQVGLSPNTMQYYPHEFSGGQRQRIALARSLALDPALVVLDEPVSALDVSIRAQIMNLLKMLQERLGIAYLLIAHDLGTVRYLSHYMGVMYLGKIVETSHSEEVYSNPLHPYTKALLSAALPSHPDVAMDRILLAGEIASPAHVPTGCSFHPRCWLTKAICSQEEPCLKEASSGHLVACHLY